MELKLYNLEITLVKLSTFECIPSKIDLCNVIKYFFLWTKEPFVVSKKKGT